ncbi:hypothetical protein ABZ079_13055 [Streptomyces sp. NPDC006314]|uniref:hypothetical protein n=1 Tax=Streptomyces sp. NPDC006314 TaxID=3154475 RepID=UPI0033BBA3D1
MWSKVSSRYGTPGAGTLPVGSLARAVTAGALVMPRIAGMIVATVSAVGIAVPLPCPLTALAAASADHLEVTVGAGRRASAPARAPTPDPGSL